MWIINSDVRNTFASMYGFNFVGRNISNSDDILAACKYILCDKHVPYKSRHNAQRFSLKGHNDALAACDTLLSNLSNKVYQYFTGTPNCSNNQTNFDIFFDELCEWFRCELTKVRNMASLPPATYGNAQKMINVLFKYLTCFDDYNNFADLLSYCHVPIDNYIMRNVLLPLHVPGVTAVPSDMQYNGQGWYELNRENYISLVNAYRVVLDSSTKPTLLPFLSIDFYWWRGMSVALPTEGTLAETISEFHR